MIRAALANAQAAEVDNFIRFDVQDAQAARPNGEHGIMISNPPYGVRRRNSGFTGALSSTGHMVETALRRLACGMLTGDRDMPKFMRLSPKRKIPLFNGNLDCRLFLMDMVKGSNRG